MEVWPDNWPAIDLLFRVSSQWRMGLSGPSSLDYGPAFTLMDRMGLDDEAWNDLFNDLRVMESAALSAMRPSNS